MPVQRVYRTAHEDQHRADAGGRRGKGSSAQPISPDLKASRSPGEWLTATACTCGATYKGSTYGVTYAEGLTLLREAAISQGDATGGFKRRAGVLWAMRTIKLDRWYCDHYSCGPRVAAP
jgi:hypothetical protein